MGRGQAIPLIVLELASAIIAGYVLVRRQASLSLPLLPVDPFRRPVFALSVTTSVRTFVALGIVFVTLPFYFQDVLGRSQVATGLLMTPWPAIVALVAPVASDERMRTDFAALRDDPTRDPGLIQPASVAGAPSRQFSIFAHRTDSIVFRLMEAREFVDRRLNSIAPLSNEFFLSSY